MKTLSIFFSLKISETFKMLSNELFSRLLLASISALIDWKERKSQLLLWERWVHNMMKLLKKNHVERCRSNKHDGGEGLTERRKRLRFTGIKLLGFAKIYFRSSMTLLCIKERKEKTKQRRNLTMINAILIGENLWCKFSANGSW